MFYQLIDNDVTIIVRSESGSKMILKENVTQLSVLGGEILKIGLTGKQRNILLRFSAITAPVCADINALQVMINTWITDYLESSSGGSGGGGGGTYSAGNGLSMDPGGNIQLGNDPGGNSATLNNDREVPLNNHRISFIATNGAQTAINQDGIRLSTSGEEVPAETLITGEFVQLKGRSIMGAPAQILLGDDSGDEIVFSQIKRQIDGLALGAANAPFILKDNGKIVYSAPGNSPMDLNDTYADFNCNGTASFMRPVHNTTADVGTEYFTGNIVYTNRGATLPSLVVVDAVGIGCFFTITVVQAVSFGAATDIGTIRIAGFGSPGNKVVSSTLGSSITLCQIADGEWIALSITGTWALSNDFLSEG